MERPAKVSFDFILFNPTDKGMFGDNVIAEMTEHSSVFPTPDESMATLTADNDLLKQKTQQAMSGDKVKIQERDAAEKVWDGHFRKEGEYVQRIAGGDKLIIAQSGFHSTQTEVHPVERPGQPILDAYGNKAKGSIHAEIKALADVRGIVFIAAAKGMLANVKTDGKTVKMQGNIGEVHALFGTKRKVDFTDLTSGQEYEITAIAFNATGISDMANPISVVAP